MKLKLTIAAVLANTFAPAFDKLCDDATASMKNRYALSRTLADIRSNVDTYNSERVKLVKELGKPEADVLRAQLGRMPETAAVQKEQLRQRIEALERDGEPKSWSIDPQDAEAMKEFRAKLDELQAVEFEVFLDHAIQLTDACKLTAKDLDALQGLVAA